MKNSTKDRIKLNGNPKHPNQGFRKGFDPKRYVPAKGTKHAAGPHRRPVTSRQNFITQQLLSELHSTFIDVDDPDKRKKTKYAKMVESLVKKAMAGDMAAIEFAWERIEGKVSRPIDGRVLHLHQLEMLLPNLSDEELAFLERLSKKAIDAEPTQLEYKPAYNSG